MMSTTLRIGITFPAIYTWLGFVRLFSNPKFIVVTVVWSGDTISESPANRDSRVLIYNDEINIRTSEGGTSDGPGVLVCRHSGTPPGDGEWLRPANDTPIQSNNNDDFRIVREIFSFTRTQLARTRSFPRNVTINEGLWTCNGGGLPQLHVAIYARGK